MRAHGNARRSRATWSRRCVSSFSRASSFWRSVTHCSWDTMGWFAMLESLVAVFMVCSWLFGSVETGYEIGNTAGSNKIVVIPPAAGTAAFRFSLFDPGSGGVARDEGSELPLERLGCTIPPTVRDRLGCRIGEDVFLVPLESIEYPARRGLGGRLRDVEA